MATLPADTPDFFHRGPSPVARLVFFALLYFIGFVFWFQDYPRGGNLGGALAFAALTALTIASLGMALGAWFADRERAFQVLLATSVPFVFMCGIVFPREAMPAPINALALLIPTTPGIFGFVKLNQMGASWSEVRPEFLNMVALLLLYALLAGAVGACLGWLLDATGNLLAPIVTHGLYDFLAFLVVARDCRRSGMGDRPEP